MTLRSLSPVARSNELVDSSFATNPLAMIRQMSRLFDDVLTAPAAGGVGSPVVAPRIDISETEKEVRITAELPGVPEEDVEVDIDDDVITIRAEKTMEQRDDRQNHHLLERVYGAVQRVIRLPFKARPEQIEATVANGVLTIAVAKPAANGAHRVKVQRQPMQQLSQGTTESAAPDPHPDGGAKPAEQAA